jgi:Ca2+-transporting ATPase
MVSYCTMLDSALNAVQLIYINLVMDVIGALALASTRPQTDIAQYQAGQGNIMTPFMYRQILGMTMHMTVIMMVIMYSGKQIFNLEFDNATQAIDKDDGGRGQNKMVYYTLVWNTFIFLQVFNLINCRDVSATKMHGFSGLIRNPLTWIMLLIISGTQFLACFTFLGRPIFETAKTGGRGFLICVFAASSALLANALLKLIPQRWIAKIPVMDESAKIGGNSKLMSAYQSQADAKGLGFGKKKEDAQPVN